MWEKNFSLSDSLAIFWSIGRPLIHTVNVHSHTATHTIALDPLSNVRHTHAAHIHTPCSIFVCHE